MYDCGMRGTGLIAVSVLLASSCVFPAAPGRAPKSDALPDLATGLPGKPVSGVAANPSTDRCYVLWKSFTGANGAHENAWLVDAPASEWVAAATITSADPTVSIWVVVDTTNGLLEAKEVAVPVGTGQFTLSTQSLAEGSLATISIASNMDLLHFDLDPNGTGSYGVTATVAGNGGAGNFSGTWSHTQYAEPHLTGGTGSGLLLADFAGTSVTFGASSALAACYTPL